MLHLRIVVPARCADEVTALLAGDPAVTNVIVLPGAARRPLGDVVLCDAAREAADEILDRLRALGVDDDGSIAVEQVDTAISRGAEDAERAAPGLGADALVWEEVQQRTNEESQLSWTYLLFLCIATLIAGAGVLLDQSVLIVGAMVVGPEFGAVAGLCVATVRRQARLARRSAVALVVGFPIATLVGQAAGLVSSRMLDEAHPFTAFISRPDAFSFVVAFLAGVAGILSLTSAKSGALIGVLISVTTVPAAGNIGVALALARPHSAGGSALQLTINLAGMLAAGTTTLALQTLLLRRRRGRRSSVEPSIR